MATYIEFSSTNQYVPDRGVQRNTKQRTLIATFGDGYEQRAVDGLNPQDETITMNFANRLNSEIDALVTDLNTDIAKAVTIVIDGGLPIKGVCDDYSRNVLYEGVDGASTLSASFRRVYEP